MYWLRQNGYGDMKSEGYQKKTQDRIPEYKVLAKPKGKKKNK